MKPAAMPSIPFVDLQAQRRRIAERIDAAIGRVLDHGQVILGPEVQDLEAALCDFSGAPHSVTCANGTDALTLVLMAEGIGPGDAVFVPAFTFVATAEAVALVGATPYFVDVDQQSFTIDPASLEAGIADAAARDLQPRATIAVDLFGQPADYRKLRAIADKRSLLLVADAAQSFGAAEGERRVGTLASYTTTSFFPAKPLGCYGDGGAIFTDDGYKAGLLASLRSHGKGGDRYDNVRIGLNSRLDTLQAAILLEKLGIFESELERRNELAERYSEALRQVAIVPELAPGCRSAWAQYTLRHLARDEMIAALKDEGIPSVVYYPKPLNRQAGYRHFPTVPGGVPIAERLSAEVFSIPLHPYLTAQGQERIIAAVARACSHWQADEVA